MQCYVLYMVCFARREKGQLKVEWGWAPGASKTDSLLVMTMGSGGPRHPLAGNTKVCLVVVMYVSCEGEKKSWRGSSLQQISLTGKQSFYTSPVI